MTLTLAVTGATGFVGRAVLDHALAQGHRVRAMARKRQDDREGVEWVYAALDTPAALSRFCEGADAVLHIAGIVNAATRTVFGWVNIDGTRTMVDAAASANVRRFINVSSLAGREPSLSNYGWSKSEAEAIVGASSLDWVTVRPPAVYGPRDTEMLELFRMARWGVMLLPPPGHLSMIHVDDLARLLVALADTASDQRILEPDDGTPLSHEELAQAIGRAVGRKRVATFHASRALLDFAARADVWIRKHKAKLTPDRASYMAHPDWTSNPALRPDLSLWEPKIAAADGLAATAQWYRSNGWL